MNTHSLPLFAVFRNIGNEQQSDDIYVNLNLHAWRNQSTKMMMSLKHFIPAFAKLAFGKKDEVKGTEEAELRERREAEKAELMQMLWVKEAELLQMLRVKAEEETPCAAAPCSAFADDAALAFAALSPVEKAELLEEPPYLHTAAVRAPLAHMEPPPGWCHVCTLDLQSAKSLSQHQQGKKHRKKAGRGTDSEDDTKSSTCGMKTNGKAKWKKLTLGYALEAGHCHRG